MTQGEVPKVDSVLTNALHLKSRTWGVPFAFKSASKEMQKPFKKASGEASKFPNKEEGELRLLNQPLSNLDRRTRMQSAIATLVALTLVAVLAMELDRALKGRKADTRGRKEVATLAGSLNAVERKLDREVLWDSVALKEALYNRDAIRTGTGSEAKVRFDDGTELDLGENSLVVLDRSDDKVGIQFLKGSVFARSSGKGDRAIEIATDKGRVRLGDASQSGGEAALALRTGGAGLEVTVAQGSAQLQTDQGSTGLAANERGKMGEGGVTTEKLALVLDLPILNARFVGQEQQTTVRFRWRATDLKTTRARIQVAQDNAFKKVSFEKEVGVLANSAGRFESAFALSEGTWFWRSLTSDGAGISDIRSVRVIRHQAVRLEAPAAAAQLSYFRERPSLRMRWASSAQNGSVDRVELSPTRDFSQPIRMNEVRGLPSTNAKERRFEVSADELESGHWNWRVVSRYEGVGPEGKSVAEFVTPVREFAREQLDSLPAPQLVAPLHRAAVGISDQKRSVELSWNPVEEASQYRLMVATDPRLESLVIDQWVSGVRWEGEVALNGALYWSVQARTREGRGGNSKLSEVRQFSINREGGFRLVSPRKDQRIEFLEEKPPVKFSWESWAGAKNYVIEWSDSESFTRITQTLSIVSSPSAVSEYLSKAGANDVPMGVQYWRVKASGANDQVLAMSEVGRYQIRQQPPLVAPEKLNPIAQFRAEIDSTREKQRAFKFDWKPVEGATEYRFTLWKQTSGRTFEEFYSKLLNAPTASIERELGEGVYRWDVRSVDTTGRAGSVGSARLLEVRQSDRLPAPTLEAPADGTLVEESSPVPVTLAWEKIPGARNYRVKVYALESNGRRVLVLDQQTERASLKTPETLRSGAYVWEVSAFGLPPALENQGARQPALGPASAANFKLHWIGVLSAPSRITIRMEKDRAPASKRGPPQGGAAR